MKRTGLQIPASLLAIQSPETRDALRHAGVKLSRGVKPAVSCEWSRTWSYNAADECEWVCTKILGLKLRSTANWRPSVRERIAYPKHIRAEVTAAFAGVTLPTPPCDVTITRVGPRMLDSDNAETACKAVRDAIAALFGIDDADPLVKYAVEQRKGPYAVEIEVRRRV